MDSGMNKIAPLQKQKSLTVDCIPSPTINVHTSTGSSGQNLSPMGSAGGSPLMMPLPEVNVKFDKKSPTLEDIAMVEESSSNDEEDHKDDLELLKF